MITGMIILSCSNAKHQIKSYLETTDKQAYIGWGRMEEL